MTKGVFHKYQGTGNDFIMIDDRHNKFNLDNKHYVKHLCDRRFGIGADGLILLRDHSEFDFKMIYFNANGTQSSMCGNGGRCIISFAEYLGLISEKCTFLAIDGQHEGTICDSVISIRMSDVYNVYKDGKSHVLNTGSPHYVLEVDNLDNVDIYAEGRNIRYSDKYREEGINVNFVEKTQQKILVATYERGVENQTYSCGTGVVAAAIAINGPNHTKQTIFTKGGELQVSYKYKNGIYTDIWLSGPAVRVYEGMLPISN